MIIKRLAVGPIMANCFIAGCKETKQAVVIDPGDDSDKILFLLAELKLLVKYIINTHGHFDHVGSNKRMKEVTKAKICIHPEDAPMLNYIEDSAASFGLLGQNSPPADILLNDNDEIRFGNFRLKVLYTPGHSKGGICLYTKGHLFTGDSLFSGAIGRTDLYGGDYNSLIKSIKTKLLTLDDDTIVYPGHGRLTTIGDEKKDNSFLQ